MPKEAIEIFFKPDYYSGSFIVLGSSCFCFFFISIANKKEITELDIIKYLENRSFRNRENKINSENSFYGFIKSIHEN